MRVKIDQLYVREFGRAPIHGQIRFYYRVLGRDFLILRTQGAEFQELIGRLADAKFEFDSIDGRIICQLFPGAPAEWRDLGPGDGLVQVSLMEPRGWKIKRMTLSAAIKEHLGDDA